MAEVTADVDIPQEARRVQTRLPITDISRWVERYSVMAATLAARFPEKAPELFAYQAQIVRAERNYEPGRWVVDDRQFRREALARRDLNWSVTDPRLYSEAFTGRARTIPRCHYCLQDDHTAQYCPQNPDHPWSTWTQEVVPSGPRLPHPSGSGSAARQRPMAELCHRFNEGRCKLARCRYTHACRDCGGPHPGVSCPSARSPRARSPIRTQPMSQRWPGQHPR